MQTSVDALMERMAIEDRQNAVRNERARLMAESPLGRPVVKIVHQAGAQRNGPCPCGSGKKFKACCRMVRIK